MGVALPLIIVTPWIAWSDIRSRRIPNKALISLWLLYLISTFTMGWSQELRRHELAALLLVGGVFIHWISKGAIGMGDIKFIALEGLLFGQVQLVVQALTYSALIGLIWVAVTKKRSIPFAPSLIAGSFLVMLIGSR